MTSVTLVVGASAARREAAIAAALEPGTSSALILEGLPDGSERFDRLGERKPVQIARIAPGCPCCIGNLTMRVTLDHLLRRKPAHIYISLASTVHVAKVRAFLQQGPYEKLLTLAKDLQV